MTLIKTYFLPFLIAILLIIISFQRCNRKYDVITRIETKIDTMWVHHINTIVSKPVIIKAEPVIDTMYLPNPNYDILKGQYEVLAKKFLMKNSYSDKILVDSIGYVQVDETVTKNEILNRKLTYKLDYPIITKTVNTYINKTQIYGGLHLQGNPTSIIDQAHVGILIKNRKDQIYGIYAGPDFNGHMNYGVQMYWKIKLHK